MAQLVDSSDDCGGTSKNYQNERKKEGVQAAFEYWNSIIKYMTRNR
jgi:hypothetical protein